MPRITEYQPQIVHTQLALIADRLKEFKCGGYIRLRIERRDRSLAAARILPIHQLCIAFLYMRRIRQHDAHEVTGRACRIDLAAKSLAHEPRNTAAVVDMCVCQKDRINLRRIERERLVVHLTQTARPLIHSAIHQVSVIAYMNQIARAGHSMRRPQKFEPHRASSLHHHHDFFAV